MLSIDVLRSERQYAEVDEERRVATGATSTEALRQRNRLPTATLATPTVLMFA